MKKLFSKKSGFTLVEIVIALAIFAIMASMIAQMLHLAILRRKDNLKFEKNLQEQQEQLGNNVAATEYDSDQEKDGTLDLTFGESGAKLTIDYQMFAADGTINDKYGVNYFRGNLEYGGATSGTVTDSGSEDASDPNLVAGAQADRFDTRLVGTRGINYIQVDSVTKVSDTKYTIKMKADDSGVQDDKKNYAQFTMYFNMKAILGSGETENPTMKIKSITNASVGSDECPPPNPWQKSKYNIRKSGENGVKVAVVTNGSRLKGNNIEFTVEFERAPAEEITVNSFGTNASGGKYTKYETTINGKTYSYENIYGAYGKIPAETPEPTT